MAGSPQYKVFSAAGTYVAGCKFAEDAALLAHVHGKGSTVKWHHGKVVWREGSEEVDAGESVDHAAKIITWRVADIHSAHMEKITAQQRGEI